MNLLNFLPGGWGKHKGGGEWAGPCPRCGGNDRFVVWPEHRSGTPGGKFLCRGCTPEGGDCIQFLRDFQGMSYPEACEALQVETRQGNTTRPATTATKETTPWRPEAERLPSEQWQDRARSFLAECQKELTTDAAKAVLQARALDMDFALKHGLGWNPAERYDAPEAWGLEPWLNAHGNPGKLYLPGGLVVPTFRKSGPVAVKIRRHNWQPNDSYPKYHAIKGGGNGALVLGGSTLPVALVESEIDALLIAQEAPELCAVVAIASAGNRPHTTTADFLATAPLILVALDFDKPDSKGRRAGLNAWLWWREHFTNVKRWPPATGKDPGEMHSSGIPVRAWVELGITEAIQPITSPQPQEHIKKTHQNPPVLPESLFTSSDISHEDFRSTEGTRGPFCITQYLERWGVTFTHTEKKFTANTDNVDAGHMDGVERILTHWHDKIASTIHQRALQ